MHKKLVAALTIAIFVFSSVAILTPASAHFTLGDYIQSSRFHANDFDPHVAGPLSYVWPGSGLAAFTGTPNSFPPGYQTPYPGGNPPGQPSSIYQLEGNAYAPFGAILTSTDDHANKGPLIFALNFSDPCHFTEISDSEWGLENCPNHYFALSSGIGPAGLNPQQEEVLPPHINFTGVTIYIAPEFDLTSAYDNYGLMSTTFSATTGDLELDKSGPQDPIGPNWWVFEAEGNIQFWPEHDYGEWFYIRINDVVAPKIAGKYFFKIFLWDDWSMNVPGAWNLASCNVVFDGECDQTVKIPESGATVLTVPVENWPVLLVKGEIDPGIVTGTIRYGTFNTTLYNRPINLPGRVRLVGVANDPYTGASTGRAVEAVGYFNASASGHYEVEGVAAGVYDVYASAAGYPEQLIASGVTILPGQSFHLDGYLNPGAVVHGQIFSKHLFGEEPWPSNPRPVLVELYSTNDYAEESVLAWSPWNKTHAGYMAYDWPQGSSVPEPLPVAYPWDTVTGGAGPSAPFSYYSKSFPAVTGGDVVNQAARTCGGNADPCGKPDGVGAAQYWWVDRAGRFTNGGGSNSFIFQFGVKGVYGAPTEINGHIPQPYATWVNGLVPGRYWLRAWINGYVQTVQDGVTLDEQYFDIAKDEWAGDVFQPMDLRVSSVIRKTVHFHDQPGTLQECPINGCPGNLAQGNSAGDRYLIAEVRDSEDKLVGLNFTYVLESAGSATIDINGLGMMGPDPENDDIKFSYYRYVVGGGYGDVANMGRDYGLPSGTYKVYVYMRGYVQQTFESVSVTLSGSPAIISNHLYRGARFNITVYSIDWEHPRIQRPWSFPGARLRVYVYDEEGTGYGHVGSRYQPAGIGGSIISGSCNLAPAEIPDHCHIVEWDGYRYTELDTADSSAFGTYAPYDQLFMYGSGFLLWPDSYYRFSEAPYKPYSGLESGTYSFKGYTYGYVQHKDFSVYVSKGGFGDIKLNLLQGVNITLNIPFKKEGIYSPTEFNMTMRVRVFDDQGNLIATSQSKVPDSGLYDNTNPNGIGRCPPTGDCDYAASSYSFYTDPFAVSPCRANGLTSIDGSSKTADGFLWYGTYAPNTADAWEAYDSDINHDGVPEFSTFNSAYGYYFSWIPAGTKQVRVFTAGIYDVEGTRYGIDGFSSTIPNSYSGSYTVEVDTWNEYLPHAYYPPVDGLLEGDSFHTIAGHPAGPFGYVGDSLAANGLGPYAQRSVWTLPNGHLGSEVSGVFELDMRGFISGNIYGFTWSDELRTQSWITVQASAATGDLTFTQWSWDGHYGMYLDAGQYNLQVIAWTPTDNQGYNTISSSVNISSGQSTSGITFQMERSNIPIPEFSGLAVAAFSALAASLYLLRRRRH